MSEPAKAIAIYIDADAGPVKAEIYRVAERYGRLANSGPTPQIDDLPPWASSVPKKQAAAWKGRLSNVMLLQGAQQRGQIGELESSIKPNDGSRDIDVIFKFLNVSC